MLLRQLLPAIRQISTEFSIFRKDSARMHTHTALEAVNVCFWATVCKRARQLLSDVSLSVYVSVFLAILVYCCQTVG